MRFWRKIKGQTRMSIHVHVLYEQFWKAMNSSYILSVSPFLDSQFLRGDVQRCFKRAERPFWWMDKNNPCTCFFLMEADSKPFMNDLKINASFIQFFFPFFDCVCVCVSRAGSAAPLTCMGTCCLLFTTKWLTIANYIDQIYTK